MRAKVKNIAFDTSAETDEYEDVFTMTDLIGKTINIEPKPKCPGWYTSGGYKWHKSWLDILPDTLLPDEPKAEWMRVDLDAYVNMKTGITVQFFKDTDGRSAWVSSLFTETVKYHATGSLADAFAALVGYTFKAGDA